MVKLERLDKYFNKGRANENHVLREISLELGDRGLVCILGESGSGKTTLLNTIGGLDTFRSGSVTVDDVVLKKYDSKRIEALRNQKFGYIFQNYYLLQDYTVAYNVKLALNVFDLTEEEKDSRVDYVLESLGMSRYKKKRVSQLSGGQQQRVSIARALVKSPEIILADEPTGNLDEENTLKIMGILKSISKECLVILVSHERAIAQFFADRIIEIKDGQIQKDYENHASGAYQKMDDSNIYLRDMEREDVDTEAIHISLYKDISDNGESEAVDAQGGGGREDVPETEKGRKSLRLNLAWKDGKLYIQSVDDVDLVLAGEDSGCIMIDANRPKLEQSQAEEVAYDLPGMKAGRSLGLPAGEIWKLACENIRMLGKKHRFIVGILLATSVLLVLALADFMVQYAVNKQNVVTEDSHYVTVRLEATKAIDKKDMNKLVKSFCKEALTEDIDYSALTDGTLTVSYDGFRQLKQVNGKIENFSVVNFDKVKKEDLVCGRLPKNRKEIVIDKWLLSTFKKSGSVMAELYQNEKALLGVAVSTLIPNLELTIVGVVDKEEPTVYASENVMLGMNYSEIRIMSDEELRALNPDKYGDLTLADDEILVDSERYAAYQEQQRWESGDMTTGQAQEDLNMKKCKIVGEGPENAGAAYVLSEKNCDRIRMEHIMENRKFKVYTDDVDATIAYFQEKGHKYRGNFRVDAQSSAQSQLEAYRKEQRKSGLNAGYIVTIAIALLSLIVIYFTIKSNAMARSEELTVYRLIGIAPGSIMKAYMLEMILITAYTCIPAVAVTSGIIKFIASIPSLEIYLLFPWWMAILLVAALFLVNVFISILPVSGILRRPPAQLAAKN